MWLGARAAWLKLAYPAVLSADRSGARAGGDSRCCLPKLTFDIRKTLHLQQPKIENHKLGPLPQIFADQFGWEEMTATVAGVYNSLPEDIRSQTAIFGQSYGQAGAIDLFGPKYGLPPAISGHQSYFLWGPRDYTGASMIVMGGDRREAEQLFASVVKVRAHRPSVFDAVQPCRRLLLPGAEAAVSGALAKGEALGLMSNVVETKLRVRYAETDQMGIVYHANYLIWMEVGRVEYCRSAGIVYRDMEREEGILLAVVEVNCRYISPALYDEEVIVRTWIAEANPRMLRFEYEMVEAERDGALRPARLSTSSAIAIASR